MNLWQFQKRNRQEFYDMDFTLTECSTTANAMISERPREPWTIRATMLSWDQIPMRVRPVLFSEDSLTIAHPIALSGSQIYFLKCFSVSRVCRNSSLHFPATKSTSATRPGWTSLRACTQSTQSASFFSYLVTSPTYHEKHLGHGERIFSLTESPSKRSRLCVGSFRALLRACWRSLSCSGANLPHWPAYLIAWDSPRVVSSLYVRCRMFWRSSRGRLRNLFVELCSLIEAFCAFSSLALLNFFFWAPHKFFFG